MANNRITYGFVRQIIARHTFHFEGKIAAVKPAVSEYFKALGYRPVAAKDTPEKLHFHHDSILQKTLLPDINKMQSDVALLFKTENGALQAEVVMKIDTGGALLRPQTLKGVELNMMYLMNYVRSRSAYRDLVKTQAEEEKKIGRRINFSMIPVFLIAACIPAGWFMFSYHFADQMAQWLQLTGMFISLVMIGVVINIGRRIVFRIIGKSLPIAADYIATF